MRQISGRLKFTVRRHKFKILSLGEGQAEIKVLALGEGMADHHGCICPKGADKAVDHDAPFALALARDLIWKDFQFKTFWQ